MCFSSPPDPSKELRKQEQERQAQIATGTAKIDEIFGGFNDDFYNQRSKAQLDYYLPQAEDQYRKAYADTVYRLANSGGITSSAGANLLGDLNKSYEVGKQRILDDATAAALGLKSNMASNRANMITLLNNGNSVQSVADMASAQALSARQAPSYSALGDLFSQFTNQIGNSVLAGAMTTPNASYNSGGPGSTSRSSKAVYTVN